MFKTVGWPEVIIVLVVVLLIFGVGRISKIAGEIGSGIRAFKEGLTGGEKNNKDSEEESQDDL